MFIIDLSTAVLCLGKYIEHYQLEVEPFIIDIDRKGSRITQNIDPHLAQKFYLGRKTLVEFVEELDQ